MKKKAIWKGEVIAESDDLVNIENNYYFPKSSVNEELLEQSNTTTYCPWKGTANYYSLNINGEQNKDAVWYYEHPSDAAKVIKDRVAFWKGVEVVDA